MRPVSVGAPNAATDGRRAATAAGGRAASTRPRIEPTAVNKLDEDAEGAEAAEAAEGDDTIGDNTTAPSAAIPIATPLSRCILFRPCCFFTVNHQPLRLCALRLCALRLCVLCSLCVLVAI